MALWGSGVRLPTAPPLKKRVYTTVWDPMPPGATPMMGDSVLSIAFLHSALNQGKKSALLDQNGSEAGRV